MEDKDITCEICGIAFWSRPDHAKSNRKRHMREVHSTPQLYHCSKCEKSFSRKDTLQNHIKSKHDDEKVESLICTTCDKAFAGKETLTRHIRHVHEKEQKFLCPVCPQKFSRLDNLRRHEKRGKHTFEYECDHCGKTFSFNSEIGLQRFLWNDHLIDQYKSYETCVDAIFVPEEKKIELLRSRVKGKLEEAAKTTARNRWRSSDGNYNDYEKKEIECRKQGLDKAIERNIEEAKKYWWWSNEDGIKSTNETDPKKKRRHLFQERSRVSEEKRLKSKQKYEEYMNQTFQCPLCEKTVRGPQHHHVHIIGENRYVSSGTICDTGRLPEKIKEAALKREGILEFLHGALICGCGCGSKHYDSKFHY